MAALDRLAPDQRAALMLILQQGQSYDDLAELLATDAAAIRARAHAAVDVVASEFAGELDPVRRGEITDYMLGQQSHSQREAMRGMLAESPPARAFARAVTQELAPLMPDEPPGVPEANAPAPPSTSTGEPTGADPASAIATTAADLPSSRRREAGFTGAERTDPDDVASADRTAPRASTSGPALQPASAGPAPSRSASERRAARARATAARGPEPAGPEPARPGASSTQSAAGRADSAAWEPGKQTSRPASTRLGGIILILVAAAAVVAGIVLFANSGGSSTSSSSTATKGSTPTSAPTGSGATGTSGPQGASRVQVLANVPLSPSGGSRARGAAEVVQQQGTNTRAFLIAGTGLQPSSSTSAYAVWLYNTANDAVSLGFFSQAVGSKGQLEGTAAVPANANRYTQIIITRETTSRPVRPGTIVLRGALKLPAG